MFVFACCICTFFYTNLTAPLQALISCASRHYKERACDEFAREAIFFSNFHQKGYISVLFPAMDHLLLALVAHGVLAFGSAVSISNGAVSATINEAGELLSFSSNSTSTLITNVSSHVVWSRIVTGVRTHTAGVASACCVYMHGLGTGRTKHCIRFTCTYIYIYVSEWLFTDLLLFPLNHPITPCRTRGASCSAGTIRLGPLTLPPKSPQRNIARCPTVALQPPTPQWQARTVALPRLARTPRSPAVAKISSRT